MQDYMYLLSPRNFRGCSQWMLPEPRLMKAEDSLGDYLVEGRSSPGELRNVNKFMRLILIDSIFNKMNKGSFDFPPFLMKN